MTIAQAGPPPTPPTVYSVQPMPPMELMQPIRQQTRIALLLPTRSTTLRAASQAVQAGFMAAYEREKDNIEVTVIETGEAPQEVLSGYNAASAQNDIVVGPLSRSGVALVAQRAAVAKPTIALTAPEAGPDNVEPVLPRQMLVIGLSIEDEARQAANWASMEKTIAKAYVVGTATAWQRRTAKAFATQWQHLGFEAEMVELNAPDGYLNGKQLLQLKKRVQSGEPTLVFAALDAWQARQLREAIGSEVPMYGTSQLNPVALADRANATPAEQMDGTRLLDIPWQLQPDHPAVMTYPHLVVAPDEKRNPDLERLYALGIDAFRIAREISGGRTDFELDGVTGKLSVRFDAIGARFERISQPAVYRDGTVVADTQAAE